MRKRDSDENDFEALERLARGLAPPAGDQPQAPP